MAGKDDQENHEPVPVFTQLFGLNAFEMRGSGDSCDNSSAELNVCRPTADGLRVVRTHDRHPPIDAKIGYKRLKSELPPQLPSNSKAANRTAGRPPAVEISQLPD